MPGKGWRTGNVNFCGALLLKLVNNDKLRNEMGLSARDRAIHNFSQDNITLKILQLYKRLIKE